MAYRIQRPPIYDFDGPFGLKSWFQRIYEHNQSVTTVRTFTTSDAIKADTYLVLADATAGALTVSLPAANLFEGRQLAVKKIDATANVVTVDADGTDTIDGAGSAALSAQWDAITLYSVGTGWVILATY